jgi:hypothetical protein
MGPSDFGFSPAAASGLMQEAYRQRDKYLREQQENAQYAASIEKSRTGWNLLDASERGVSLSTPVAKLGVSIGKITLPMRNRQTGEDEVFSGGGLGGTLGISLGVSVLSVKLKGADGKTRVGGNPVNEAAKRVSTGESISTPPWAQVIDGEVGVPIFKGPYWDESQGSDQFSGAVGITTGTLMTPSRESIGIFNFIKNLFDDPKTLIPKTHNMMAISFYNWKAVPFLMNPNPALSQTIAMQYMEAIAFCTKEGHSANLAGLSGKQAFFKVSKD